MTKDEAAFLARLLTAELDDFLENLSVNGHPVVVAIDRDDWGPWTAAMAGSDKAGWYVRIDEAEEGRDGR